MIVEELRKSILLAAFKGNLSDKLDSDTDLNTTISEIEKEKEVYLSVHKIKKTKLFDVKEQDEPFKIPTHWKWVRWGNLSNSIQYGVNAGALAKGNVKLVRISDIVDNKIAWNTVPYSNINESEINQYILNENDILFARTGGTVGKSVIVKNIPTDEKYVFAGYLIRSNYSNQVNYKYLKYFMESPLYWSQLKSGTIGSAQPNCNGQTLSKMIIPLPPIEEQQRIVDKIEEAFAKLDEIKPIEEELKLMKSTFPSDMRKSILSQAFCGNLLENSVDSDDVSKLELLVKKSNKKYVEIYSDDLPSTWKRFKFKDLFDIVNGFTPLRSNDEFWNKKEIPWFTIEDINLQGRTINHTKQFITKKALGKSSKRLLPPNTVLLCCTASVGEYAITNIPLTTNQQFNGLIIKDELKKYILPMYLYEFVKTLKPKLLSKSGKTTFNFLSTKKLSEFEIPIPPLEEQQRIVDKIEQLLPLCDDIEQLVTGD